MILSQYLDMRMKESWAVRVAKNRNDTHLLEKLKDKFSNDYYDQGLDKEI